MGIDTQGVLKNHTHRVTFLFWGVCVCVCVFLGHFFGLKTELYTFPKTLSELEFRIKDLNIGVFTATPHFLDSRFFF